MFFPLPVPTPVAREAGPRPRARSHSPASTAKERWSEYPRSSDQRASTSCASDLIPSVSATAREARFPPSRPIVIRRNPQSRNADEISAETASVQYPRRWRSGRIQ